MRSKEEILEQYDGSYEPDEELARAFIEEATEVCFEITKLGGMFNMQIARRIERLRSVYQLCGLHGPDTPILDRIADIAAKGGI